MSDQTDNTLTVAELIQDRARQLEELAKEIKSNQEMPGYRPNYDTRVLVMQDKQRARGVPTHKHIKWKR